MSDQEQSFGLQQGASPPGQGAAPPVNYRFSKEEMQVLSECNSESFFERSMPLGTVLGMGAYFGVQKGILKPSARFGAVPKVTLAVIVGYFIGKFSYQQKCAEKLMALPDSYIGKLLRERKAGGHGKGSAPAISMFGANPSDIYSDAGPGFSLEIDTDRPVFSADDTYRPTGTAERPEQADPTKPALSYDELRKKNRGQYTDARQDPYRIEPPSGSLGAPPPVTRARTTPPIINQYGDVVD